MNPSLERSISLPLFALSSAASPLAFIWGFVGEMEARDAYAEQNLTQEDLAAALTNAHEWYLGGAALAIMAIASGLWAVSARNRGG